MSRLKDALYNFFVRGDNRIQYEYEKYVIAHLDEHRRHRLRHLILLKNLNKHYRIKHNTSPYFDELGRYWEKPKFGETVINGKKVFPESNSYLRESQEEITSKLLDYDVICFDVFDTLLFRTVSRPDDVFYLMELKYKLPEFCKLRKEALKTARDELGIHDVTIEDIYSYITPLYPNISPLSELDMEKKVIYANPYFINVVKKLINNGKKVICVSDMYLNGDTIKELLLSCGYPDIEIFSSCDYKINKLNGALQRLIREKYSNERIVFIGNDYKSDFNQSIESGLDAIWYRSCQSLGKSYRSTADESIEASLYCAIVNNYIHNGSFKCDDAFYEHGFVYGGIIVYGFCSFIDKLNKQYFFDKLLFLSRDMNVFYKVYERFFGSVESEYVLFSRFSSQQLIFDIMPGEYLQYTIKTRIGKNTIGEAFSMYDLPNLSEELKLNNLSYLDKLDKNSYLIVQKVLLENKDIVSAHFKEFVESAKAYYKKILGEAKRVCILDLGWKGTSINYLDKLFKSWGFDVECHGAIVSISGNDYAKSVLKNKQLSVYMDRDDMDFTAGVHKGANFEAFRGHVFEATFSSTEDSLLEYKGCENDFVYGRKNPNTGIIKSIQSGVIDFVSEFSNRVKGLENLLDISGFTANTPINKALKTLSYTIPIWSDVIDEATAEPGFYKDGKYQTFYQMMVKNHLAKNSDYLNEIGYMEEGNCVYICSTYSHIIVTLAHVFLDDIRSVDIILYDDLPNCFELRNRLKDLCVFNNIIIFSKEGLPQRVFDNSLGSPHLKELHYKHLIAVEEKLRVDLSKYNEIYTFYDGHHLGLYLQEKHIKYHLIEDGMNHFQHIYATPSVQEIPLINASTLRAYAEGWMYLCCGQNPDCVSIEVNENKDLAVSHTNIIERPRKKMLEALSNIQRKQIFGVFVDDFEKILKCKNKLAIVFTSVLANDGWVDNEKTQIQIYKEIVRGLQSEGYYVVIKPHPRDKVIYTKDFSDCYIMDKEFPSELLDFDTRVRFDKGVVIASSAMELIDCIDNKEKLGFKLFAKYKDHVAPWIIESLSHPEKYNW